MTRPIWVYDNWTAYTDKFEGLDETWLTEEFAMRHLANVKRLLELGVQIDYYMMNAFWYEPDGRYRVWRTPDWPDGTPDRWLAGCAELGIAPALWFGTNFLWKLVPVDEWADSVDPESELPSWAELDAKRESGIGTPSPGRMSLSDGGFFADLLDTLQLWYDRGVRLFEFDCAFFDAGTARQRATMSPEELREANIAAFVGGLTAFRDRNPGAILVGFNGYGGEIETTSSPVPFEHAVDPRFLKLFRSIYTGDLRIADVPHESFWRGMDLYTDHMVRRYEANGVPLDRLDPLGFVMSTTWFGAYRGATALRAQGVLTAARGSVKKTLYGDLGLMSEDDARWFARLQEIYVPLLEGGTTETFGGMPGEIQAYGFVSWDDGGALHTVVNPRQEVVDVQLPARGPADEARLLFADSGFVPEVGAGSVRLGPGQLALVGSGRYASAEYELGTEKDVVIPREIAALEVAFAPVGPHAVEAEFPAPAGTIRVIGQQFGEDGWAKRTVEFVPETAERLGIPESERGRSFEVTATAGGRELPIERSPVIAEFYGTSWVLAEIPAGAVQPGTPLTVRITTRDTGDVRLEASAYTVTY